MSERRLAQRTARRLNETHQAGVIGSAGGLGKKSAPTGETFIPECNEDGRFAEIQVSQARNRIKIESLRKQEKKCKNNLTLIVHNSAIKGRAIVGASRLTANPFRDRPSDTTNPTANVKVNLIPFFFVAGISSTNPQNQFIGKSSPSRRSPQGKKPRKGKTLPN
jgi:hypothetical protein